jgi:hypothetical protein
MVDKTTGGAAVAAPLVAQITRNVKLIFEIWATPEALVAEMTAARLKAVIPSSDERYLTRLDVVQQAFSDYAPISLC